MSCCMACAVVAMIGKVNFSSSLMCLAAVNPSITGIWISINTMSNALSLRSMLIASKPLLATSIVAWVSFNSPRVTFWLSALSSAKRMRVPFKLGTVGLSLGKALVFTSRHSSCSLSTNSLVLNGFLIKLRMPSWLACSRMRGDSNA